MTLKKRTGKKRRPAKTDTTKADLAKKLVALGKRTAALLKEPYRSIDHGDLLYDEKGLPK